eukprot:Amastigsp_a844132_6.p3 type:complete len:153 gc:universal Amastigsp_a844132_6:468-926(+)
MRITSRCFRIGSRRPRSCLRLSSSSCAEAPCSTPRAKTLRGSSSATSGLSTLCFPGWPRRESTPSSCSDGRGPWCPRGRSTSTGSNTPTRRISSRSSTWSIARRAAIGRSRATTRPPMRLCSAQTTRTTWASRSSKHTTTKATPSTFNTMAS